MKSKSFGPLKNTRLARTLSQEDLARLAGITQESLSKAERGVLRLRPDVQARLAAILGVSRDELFPGVEEPVLEPDEVSRDQLELPLLEKRAVGR